MNVLAIEIALRIAFKAGFMASGEGINGECHDVTTIDAELEKMFERWLNERNCD